MMPRRLLLLLATFAALLGVPSSVLATPPTQLADGVSSPEPVPSGSGAAVTAAESEADAAAELAADDPLLPLVLAFGLLGVAAVAIIGSAWLVVARRRQASRIPEPVIGVEPADLERRAQRRRREQRADDPVPAAMGITDPRRRPRAAGGRPKERPRRGRAR